MFKTICFSIKTAWKIDKARIFCEILYNFVKQFFNVFYGVYFLRTILVYIETGRELYTVFLILCLMLAVNVIFYFFNSYFKSVYLPQFEIKIIQYMYENIVVALRIFPTTATTSRIFWTNISGCWRIQFRISKKRSMRWGRYPGWLQRC